MILLNYKPIATYYNYPAKTRDAVKARGQHDKPRKSPRDIIVVFRTYLNVRPNGMSGPASIIITGVLTQFRKSWNNLLF